MRFCFSKGTMELGNSDQIMEVAMADLCKYTTSLHSIAPSLHINSFTAKKILSHICHLRMNFQICQNYFSLETNW